MTYRRYRHTATRDIAYSQPIGDWFKVSDIHDAVLAHPDMDGRIISAQGLGLYLGLLVGSKGLESRIVAKSGNIKKAKEYRIYPGLLFPR